ncbi:hypothetical protein SEEM030_07743 [Salmonella enterica subsp. enterica serovar Montevideo str. SARB30]|nr:hypothetical protein SEEM031_22185 [Salmonella enterica subsp. enterica serovar Montevideo str. SARB31]EHL49733.1 hypothetical protein SEEM030_07743 [Salmonella enterica subsp. enterica serovar Montevideo str. SARB30]ESB83001.1 hypothetical protein SEEACDC5_19546 [Salmonella enterica subsp. enterica serovar Agona str. SA-5]
MQLINKNLNDIYFISIILMLFAVQLQKFRDISP